MALIANKKGGCSPPFPLSVFSTEVFCLFHRFDIERPCICIKGQQICAGGQVVVLVAVGIICNVIVIDGTVRINYLVAIPGAVAVIYNLELNAVIGA